MKIFKRFVVSFVNEWYQLRGGFNWYSFDLIHLMFEYDKMTEGLEFEFYLLGFGIRIRYNLPASDAIFKGYEDNVKDMLNK